MITLVSRISLIFIPVFALLLITATVAVHSQPLEVTLLHGLDQCDRPCWAGIEPGGTSLARVPTLVSVRYPGRRFGMMGSTNSIAVNEDGRWINIGSHQGLVSSVQIELPFELWRLVLLYGAPTCLEPLEGVTILYWVFDDTQMIANFFPAKNGWQSHTLMLQASRDDPCHPRANRHPWRGWAAF